MPEGTPPPPDGNPTGQAVDTGTGPSLSGQQQAVRSSRWDKCPQMPEHGPNSKAEGGLEDEQPPWLVSGTTVYSNHQTQKEMPVQGRKRFWDGGLPSPFALSAPEEGENPFPEADWASPVEAPGLASPEPDSGNPASYPSPYQLSVQLFCHCPVCKGLRWAHHLNVLK